MSTLGAHKTRVTTAIGMLSKMLSAFDPSCLVAIDTKATPEIQLRTIQHRKGVISAAKLGIERALEILKDRHESLLLFVQIQDNCAVLKEEIDQFWKEQQGDKITENAQNIIAALDAQLLMDDSLQTILCPQPNNDIVTATAALSIENPPLRNGSQSEGQQEVPTSLPPSTSLQDTSMLQPIQLRRLELPTFDGDVTKFYDFWCRFKTAVHDNNSLSLSSKFIHLANSLKGRAALIIQGYDPSKPENYNLAIQALIKRYDRPQFTRNLYLQKLEQLPTSSSSASVQRDTLCQIQSFILQLNRYENTTTSLALMKTIKKKFPRDTQLEVNKLEHRSGKTWTLPELLDGLNEVIEEFEKLEDLSVAVSGPQVHTNPVSTTNSRSPTPEPRYDPQMCCFCHSYNHLSTRCHHRITPSNRRLIINYLRLCWKCLRPGHTSRVCDRPNCPRCNGTHHLILCARATRRQHASSLDRRYHVQERSRSMSKSPSRIGDRGRSTSYDAQSSRSVSRGSSYSPARSTRRTPSPEHRTSNRQGRRERRTVRFRSPVRDDTSPRGRARNNEDTRYHESSVYAAAESGDEYDQLMGLYDNSDPTETHVSTTLDISTSSSLMTVEALAIDQQTKMTSQVVLLLDTGAQRSFVSQDTINKLHIKVTSSAPITTVTFGGVRTTEQSGIVDVSLIDNRGKKLQLVLRTKDKITTPCSSVSLTQEDKLFLLSLNVQHNLLTATRTITPDILIGIDYFWDIVSPDHPQTLPSGLVLCHTRFGPTISGAKFFRGLPKTIRH